MTGVEDIKKQIKDVFSTDSDLAIKIAYCESELTQFKNGKIYRGEKNKNDIGIFQINSIIWKDEILQQKLDIYTTSGNIHFAYWLYYNFGTKPWYLSQGCWDK